MVVPTAERVRCTGSGVGLSSALSPLSSSRVSCMYVSLVSRERFGLQSSECDVNLAAAFYTDRRETTVSTMHDRMYYMWSVPTS